MDTNGGEGIAGRYDEKVKKICGFVIKVIMDLCVGGCVMYFIVEAVRNMKNDNTKHPQNDDDLDYEAFFALLLCFLVFFLLVIHLIANCLVFINDVIRSPKVEPFENDNSAIRTAP